MEGETGRKTVLHVLVEVFAPLVPVHSVPLQLLRRLPPHSLALFVAHLPGADGGSPGTGSAVRLHRAHSVLHDHQLAGRLGEDQEAEASRVRDDEGAARVEHAQRHGRRAPELHVFADSRPVYVNSLYVVSVDFARGTVYCEAATTTCNQ